MLARFWGRMSARETPQAALLITKAMVRSNSARAGVPMAVGATSLEREN